MAVSASMARSFVLRSLELAYAAGTVAAPDPLNQGEWHTCSEYAFAQCLASSLLLKYEIAVPAAKLATVVTITSPAWEGRNPLAVIDQWNSKSLEDSTGIWVEDMGQSRRYQVIVRAVKLNFTELYTQTAE